MVRRKLTITERWHAVGMHMSQAGFSSWRMAGQMGVHHSEISHLMQCLQATGMVYERPRSCRSSKTTPREQRLIARCASRIHFATSAHIRDELNFGGHVSVRTANTDRRSHDHLHRNICYWKRVHWSDKNWILLHPVDVRVWVWQHRNTSFHDGNVMGTKQRSIATV